MVEACERNGIRLHGPGRPYQAGVCHRIVVEDYALPGDIIVLTDSHTPTAGVLNAFAFGVGSTAMAFALRTGLIPVTVPKTVVRVEVVGDAAGCSRPRTSSSTSSATPTSARSSGASQAPPTPASSSSAAPASTSGTSTS
jgi:hypothetical protein